MSGRFLYNSVTFISLLKKEVQYESFLLVSIKFKCNNEMKVQVSELESYLSAFELKSWRFIMIEMVL